MSRVAIIGAGPCGFDDNLIEYEEQLVVFASINAGFPVSDTVYVSRTAGVSESTDAQDLYIDDANVKLINVSDGSEPLAPESAIINTELTFKPSFVVSVADILFIISPATLSVHFDHASTTFLCFTLFLSISYVSYYLGGKEIGKISKPNF